jgi:hypothetical protein
MASDRTIGLKAFWKMLWRISCLEPKDVFLSTSLDALMAEKRSRGSSRWLRIMLISSVGRIKKESEPMVTWNDLIGGGGTDLAEGRAEKNKVSPLRAVQNWSVNSDEL